RTRFPETGKGPAALRESLLGEIGARADGYRAGLLIIRLGGRRGTGRPLAHPVVDVFPDPVGRFQRTAHEWVSTDVGSLSDVTDVKGECSMVSAYSEDWANRVRRRPGAPLPRPQRDFFERGFDCSLDSIRLHVDPDAAAALDAEAFAVGRHIVLRAP